MNKFYSLRKIKGEKGEKIARIDLYGIVEDNSWFDEDDSITPTGLLNDLNALGEVDQINLHIFSNGGDVHAGLAIYEMLKNRPEKTVAYIEGMAASIATVITCACDEVYIGSCSQMMLHAPWAPPTLGGLNAKEARELADYLDTVRVPIIQAYMAKTGRTEAEILEVLECDTYFTAQQAIDFGLADAITPAAKEPLKAAARIRPGVFMYEGKTIDFTKYVNAGKMTADIATDGKSNKRPKGVMRMAKGRKKGLARARRRIVRNRKMRSPRAELVEVECPYCNETCVLDTDSYEVAVDESSEPEAKARRVRNKRFGKVRSEVYTFDCPYCSKEIAYDDDEMSDGDEAKEVIEVEEVEPEEIDAEARRAKASRKRARKAKARKRDRAKAKRALKAELGDDYEVVEEIADEVEDVLDDALEEIVYDACKEVLVDYVPAEDLDAICKEIAKEVCEDAKEELPEDIAVEVYEEVIEDEVADDTPLVANSRRSRRSRNGRGRLAAMKRDASAITAQGANGVGEPRSYAELQKMLKEAGGE